MKKLLAGFLFISSMLVVSCGTNCPSGQTNVNGTCTYANGAYPYGGTSPYGYGTTSPYGYGTTSPYGYGSPYGTTSPYGYGSPYGTTRPPQCMNVPVGGAPGC